MAGWLRNHVLVVGRELVLQYLTTLAIKSYRVVNQICMHDIHLL